MITAIKHRSAKRFINHENRKNEIVFKIVETDRLD